MNHGPTACDNAVILASHSKNAARRTGSWALAAAILGSSMAFIDGTAVNVALPAIQSALHASVTEIQWLVESYTLFLAALLLTGGSLGDLFGQARIFGIGVILFTAASVWCGLSPNITDLIVARAVQGVGGALLVPTSLALVSVSFPREELGNAIGLWSGLTSIAAAAGPVIGGFLAQHFSWRWVFFINVPIAVAVLAIVKWRVPASAPAENRPAIDWSGTVLATLGLGGVVYGFLQSSATAGVAGALALAGFVVVEWRERSPMLPLTLFKSLDFTGTGLLTLFLYGALSGVFFFLPLNLVQVQGYSETAAGAALLPFIVLVGTLSRWSGRLLDRFPARALLTVGPLLASVGFVLFSMPGIGGSYWTTFFPGCLVLGFGMAITVAPLTTTVMNSVGSDRAGIASGVNNALSRVAGLIAIAGFGIVMTWVFNRRLDSDPSLSAGQRAQIDRSKLAAAAKSGPEANAVKESFVSGFRAVMWVGFGLAVIGAASSALLIGRQKPRVEGAE
ncbi:MFS transporter [Fimbriimonas ginsengisoli]|uniref:Drug resistance transporter, EmrB/QacA subfamily n=1 Tax=Fimbriimonas ginsengisoli Gsoil 348 TaxID=661478 RepID=A0A068NTC9_FIMGI|nr:MFS transporter [Fimbriimonas ginsengisoli]AIE84879.1 drug resistance transporter, EmrB/QacA subfamily [Fimbriimonas ginsengisoli Gsoil 348]